MSRRSGSFSAMCFNGDIMKTFCAKRACTYQCFLRSWAVTALMLMFAAGAKAESTNAQLRLTVVPNQCVVLEQGQKCHANAQVKWAADRPRSVCLHSSLTQRPLKCWEHTVEGAYQEKVVARSNVSYFLKPSGGGEILAETELNVAWVYRESRRPTRQWRLF